MESLVDYGSEEELDEPSYKKKSMYRQADANYEAVRMDLSEDSSNSDSHQRSSKSKDAQSTRRKKDKSRRGSDDYKSRYDEDRYSPKSTKRDYKSRDKDRYEDKYDSKSRYADEKSRDYRSENKERNKNRDYKKRDNSEERYKESKNYDSRVSQKKYSRESDRERLSDSRDTYNRSSKSYDSRDNTSRKFSSPSRHRSRSPAPGDSRSRRSNSKDKGCSSYSSKYYDRSSSKMDRLEKLGIELGESSERASTSAHDSESLQNADKNRFFMPGITGRFTEQIQRRKMLWQKKDSQPVESGPPLTPGVQSGKVWQNTTFAQDSDGKVANKFKRLMGIKGEGAPTGRPTTENLKKQEEMFTSMEAQYEVARTATHTMRGVGLGFGSFQR